jgi:hypothetical protein
VRPVSQTWRVWQVGSIRGGGQKRSGFKERV